MTEKSREPFAFVARGDRISFKLRLATNLKACAGLGQITFKTVFIKFNSLISLYFIMNSCRSGAKLFTRCC